MAITKDRRGLLRCGEEQIMTDIEADLAIAKAEIETLKKQLKDRPEAIFCKQCSELGIKDFAFGYCKAGRIEGILTTEDGCTRGSGRK